MKIFELFFGNNSEEKVQLHGVQLGVIQRSRGTMIAPESPFFWLTGLGIFAAGLQIAWLFLSKPVTILYALAISVSFTAVNVNIGFTIYVSRLLLFALVLVILVRSSAGIKGGFRLSIDQKFLFSDLFVPNDNFEPSPSI